MALSRRSQRMNSNIWPGFVDAMTGLLLVLMFVLTIFMVIQFVLRETITGQASELDSLAGQIASLTDALGLAEDTNTALVADNDAQSDRIAALVTERDAAGAALQEAQNQITGFEAQVAGLLAQRQDLSAQVAGLEAANSELLTEQDQLNLALATARDEVDAEAEAARLAAARRDALQAMVDDLRQSETAQTEQISALEAEKLVDAAAAQALRDRLQDADTELTAMSLNLEEQRRKAEETLTLLAASQAARDDLQMNLSAALLAQQQAQNDLAGALSQGSDLDARLAAALSLQDSTAAELADARASLDAASAQADDLTARLAAAVAARRMGESDLADAQAALDAAIAQGEETEASLQSRLAAMVLAQEAAQAERDNAATQNATLEDRLAEAVLARDALRSQIDSLSETTTESQQDRADLQARLAAALASQSNAVATADRQATLLETARTALRSEEAASAEAQRQTALLNEQVARLRQQVGSLQSLLNVASDDSADAQVQIEQLGSQLNTALARVAAEERRRRTLEEAERVRLEEETARLQAEAQDLERFRSDFFGQLRNVVEGLDGVQIAGDRFVFSSEVLFGPGDARLSPQGQVEIGKVAGILRQIAADIPDGIDWIIRVDGHTDNLPLSGNGRYADNWELSQARALSVVKFMETLGIAPGRMSANGFAEFQPLNPANTPDARAQNRRIELKLTER